MLKKILISFVLGLGLILPTHVLADGDPVITSVSTTSANNGDTVTISGQNFLVSNTDTSTLKAYLFMSSGGSYLLASVSPTTNNTQWQQSAIQFKITDSIARSGTISVTVNNKVASWNQTFNMNGGAVPTSTSTPYPTSIAATPTRTPTPTTTSTTNSNTTTSNNPTSKPAASPTIKPSTPLPNRTNTPIVGTNSALLPTVTDIPVIEYTSPTEVKTSWISKIFISISNLFKSIFKR